MKSALINVLKICYKYLHCNVRIFDNKRLMCSIECLILYLLSLFKYTLLYI